MTASSSVCCTGPARPQSLQATAKVIPQILMNPSSSLPQYGHLRILLISYLGVQLYLRELKMIGMVCNKTPHPIFPFYLSYHEAPCRPRKAVKAESRPVVLGPVPPSVVKGVFHFAGEFPKPMHNFIFIEVSDQLTDQHDHKVKVGGTLRIPEKNFPQVPAPIVRDVDFLPGVVPGDKFNREISLDFIIIKPRQHCRNFRHSVDIGEGPM